MNRDSNKMRTIDVTIDAKKLLDCMIQEASNVVSKASDVANHVIHMTGNPVSTLILNSFTIMEHDHNPLTEPVHVFPGCNGTTNTLSSFDTTQAQGVEAMMVSNKKVNADGCKMNRTASFLSMPPPPPKVHTCPNSSCGTTRTADDIWYEKITVHSNERSKFRMGLDLLCEAAAVSDSRIVTPDLAAKKSSSALAHAIPSLDLDESSSLRDFALDSASTVADTTTDSMTLADVSCLSPDQCAEIIDTCLFETDSAFDFLPPIAKRPKLSDDIRSFPHTSLASFQAIFQHS
jgi:hypothetical protein